MIEITNPTFTAEVPSSTYPSSPDALTRGQLIYVHALGVALGRHGGYPPVDFAEFLAEADQIAARIGGFPAHPAVTGEV